jgi:hypothetical protein
MSKLSKSRRIADAKRVARRNKFNAVCESLEGRQLLSSATVAITAINAVPVSADLDNGQSQHVSVVAGTTVKVDFDYNTAPTNPKSQASTTATLTIGNPNNPTLATTSSPETTGLNQHAALSVLIPDNAPRGVYNTKVDVLIQNSDGTDSEAGSVEVVVNVIPTTVVHVNGTGTYGGTGSVAATLEKTSDSSFVSGKTINFYKGAVDPANLLGSATTDTLGVATLQSAKAFGLNAGETDITAVFAGDDAYASSSGTGSLLIAKADAKVDVTGYDGTYDGAAHGATGTVTGVLGEQLSGLDLGANFTDCPGGKAHWVFDGGTNYNSKSGDVEINIAKADATIKIDGYSGTYDGAAHGATGHVTGVDAGGAATGSSLDLGASFTNCPGGTAHWVFDGGTNYNNQSGDVAINIAKARVSPSVTLYDVTYDGKAHTATGTVTGVLGEDLNALLDIRGTTHTNAGTYTDTWTFAGNDNYEAASGIVVDHIAQKSLCVDFITQAALNLTKQGAVSFTAAAPTGLVTGDTVKALDGATITVTVPDGNGSTSTFTATLAVDQYGQLSFSLVLTATATDGTSLYNDLKSDTTATSAAKAPTVYFVVSGSTQNYTFTDDDVATKLFSTTK